MSKRASCIFFFSAVYLIFSFIAASSWNSLTLPYKNPLDVVGPLSLQRFNPNTNVLRYLVFIFSPSIAVSVLLVMCGRLAFKEGLPDTNVSALYKHIYGTFSLGLCIIFILKFFNQNFSVYPLDFFHTGEQLTPAFHYVRTGGLWTASYFVHGLIRDPWATAFVWKFFGAETIGLSIIIGSVLIYSAYLSFTVFMSSILFLQSGRNNTSPYYLMLCSLLAMIFLGTNQMGLTSLGRDIGAQAEAREALFFLSLTTVVISIGAPSRALYFVIGLLIPFNFLYSIDMGAYFCAISVAMAVAMYALIYFRRLEMNFPTLPLFALAGAIIGTVMSCCVLGTREFSAFIETTLYLFRTKDQFDSYIYPSPLVDLQGMNLHRLLPMLSISLGLYYFVIKYISHWIRNTSFNSRNFLIHLLFVATAIVTYRSALGRSDIIHVRYSALFPYLLLAFPLADMILKLGARFLNPVLSVGLVVNFVFLLKYAEALNTGVIKSSFASMKALAKAEDRAFLSSAEQAGIQRLQEILKDEPCVYSLTSEAALPYLLKKPSCTRHFVVWFATPRPLRKELYEYLSVKKPRYVIVTSTSGLDQIDGVGNGTRFPKLLRHLKKWYEPYEVVMGRGWVVLERKAAS